MTPSASPCSRGLALGGSLPVLLEYRNGHRWRISAGLLIEGLLLGAVLTVPLLFPDRFPAVQIAQVSPPIWRGDWQGNPDVDKLGGGKQPKPDRNQRADATAIHFPTKGDAIPSTDSVGPGPDISVGPGNGEQRLGDPNGPLYGKPPDTPIQTTRPHPPAPNPEPVPVGGNIRSPRLLQRVEPVYPRLAIAAHIEGDVVLTAIIETDGRVRQVTVKNGHPSLGRAAREAVAQWLYEPTTLNGQPVAVQLDVTVKFRLNH